jgi:hypothetical protein
VGSVVHPLRRKFSTSHPNRLLSIPSGAVGFCLPRLYSIAAQFNIIIFCLIIATLLGGCEGSRKRPVGYFHLGNASELAAEEEHLFGDLRILLRHDKEGFSAMSTECPYDGAVLARVRQGDSWVWRSPTSGSVYDEHGKVLRGPSSYSLPFYELRLDRDSYAGKTPTLYVHVGVEREEGWRLK